MKKLMIILTAAAFVAGCHTRDESTGGTGYETMSTTGTNGNGNYSTTNQATQGSGASNLNTNSTSKPSQ